MAEDALKAQVKDAIIQSLNLTLSVADIDDDVLLFGEGLGLDSIDALEIVLEIERTFGVQIGDEDVGRRVLQSVTSVADFIESTRRASV